MNRLAELVNNPFYSFKIQDKANKFPTTVQARYDVHSNYQSMLSDLAEPILGIDKDTAYIARNQYLEKSNISASHEIFSFGSQNALKDQRETTETYKEPISVKTDTSLTATQLKLFSCLSNSRLELDSRLPLAIKDIKPSTNHLEVLETLDGNDFIVYVKERCHIGLLFVVDEGIELTQEDYFYKTKTETNEDIYSFSTVHLINTSGEIISRALITYKNYIHFPGSFVPGIYTVRFNLINPNQLDNITVEIVENINFGKSNKYFTGGGIVESGSPSSYQYVFDWVMQPSEADPDNDYLKIVLPNEIDKYSVRTHSTYTLLDEDDSQMKVDDWMMNHSVLWVLSHPETAESADKSKIHIFDTQIDGNRFIYEDNDKFFIDLVCESYDYIPGDTITLETRFSSLPSDLREKIVRLRVENSEDVDPETGTHAMFYVNSAGETVSEDNAWIYIDTQMVRWDYTLSNIGSYRFSVEVYDDKRTVRVAGAKLVTVKYKYPWRTFELDDNYFGYNLGSTADDNLELINSNDYTEKYELSFYKDGYSFDKETGYVWTNIPCDSLVVEYSDE